MSCPYTILVLKVKLVVLVSDFVMVSTVWSVSCMLFFYARCPPCPAICKSGGTCPRAPWSRRHCVSTFIRQNSIAYVKSNVLRFRKFAVSVHPVSAAARPGAPPTQKRGKLAGQPTTRPFGTESPKRQRYYGKGVTERQYRHSFAGTVTDIRMNRNVTLETKR